MMQLFHGSFVEVCKPNVQNGRGKVDFGQGFYLTKLEKQASSWARTIAGRHRNGIPVLNEYSFDYDAAKLKSGERFKVFGAYNLEWLDYVIDCRRGGDLCRQYDIVEGGVANDNVIDTVEDFEKGVITAEQALGQLIYKPVNHQIAILSQDIVDLFLSFRGSHVLPKEEV